MAGIVLLFSLEIGVVQGFSPLSIPQVVRPHIFGTTTRSDYHHHSPTRRCLALSAKKARPLGRGKRRDPPTPTTGNDNNKQQHHDKSKSKSQPSTSTDLINITKRVVRVPFPSKTKRVSVSLERIPPLSSLVLFAVQVDDPQWWQHVDNTNPFGARCWPSSMAVAQFLALLGTSTSLQDRQVLELGCGTGLPSLAAACCGANVVASDISPVALSLMRQGWMETQSQTSKSKRRQRRSVDLDANADDSSKTRTGTLTTLEFDLFSNLPLPLVIMEQGVGDSNSNSNSSTTTRSTAPPIVIAAAMMYEADLAQGLARRLMEACSLGAWVILGDDDTGERDGGRASFLAEFARLEDELLLVSSTRNDNTNLRKSKVERVWTDVIVKNAELGWREKQVRLLHLNPPPGILSASNDVSSIQQPPLALL